MQRLAVFSTTLATVALSQAAFSTPYYGTTISYGLYSKEPANLDAYQFMLVYDPQSFKWRKFNIYFDGGFSHLRNTNTSYYRILNIYSAAPVIRYTFTQLIPLYPYIELSIGSAYLNHTRLENRNLGMHFAFQDRAGIGAYMGDKQQLSIGIHAVHYSNAHLCDHNSGVTIPLVLDVGYRFQ